MCIVKPYKNSSFPINGTYNTLTINHGSFQTPNLKKSYWIIQWDIFIFFPMSLVWAHNMFSHSFWDISYYRQKCMSLRHLALIYPEIPEHCLAFNWCISFHEQWLLSSTIRIQMYCNYWPNLKLGDTMHIDMSSSDHTLNIYSKR